MKEKSCETCKYWTGRNRERELTNKGYCVRNPPSAVRVHSIGFYGTVWENGALWPETWASAFCGEYGRKRKNK